MDKQFGKDLTTGSIPRHLLLFSIPMLAGNAMQIGYGIVNTIWVGHLVGENAVGAVGVSFPVIYVLVGICHGHVDSDDHTRRAVLRGKRVRAWWKGRWATRSRWP